MSAPFPSLLEEFGRAVDDCRRIYLDAARDCGASHPHLLDCSPYDFLVRMKDLHTGLLVKVFVEVTGGQVGSQTCEERLAQALFLRLWNRKLSSREVQAALPKLMAMAKRFSWSNVVGPFVRLAPLRERRSELATVVMRVANLTAKSDGLITAGEQQRLRSVENAVWRTLREPDEGPPAEAGPPADHRPRPVNGLEILKLNGATDPQPQELDPAQNLERALEDLDGLIGLDSVKREVRTLANYLKVQQHRRSLGLPETSLSLHMIFEGNPGTGKTTVARIIGRILGALGVLQKGHLVETDRAGLVAEFAGQTGPKTHRRIDEALDGVLFIDEAYSLAGGGAQDDAYGQDALQTLLKRMEDDRQRLAVILAGYPEPMETMLRSNPGLSSRFNTRLVFEDYDPPQLAAIFERMCRSNHYKLHWKTRVKLLLGFQWAHQHRTKHWGNGREVRNVFERAVRRLANRVAELTPITREALTRLKPEDLEFPGTPASVFQAYDNPQRRLSVRCPHCQSAGQVLAKHLGRRFPCHQCQQAFVAAWGAPLVESGQ